MPETEEKVDPLIDARIGIEAIAEHLERAEGGYVLMASMLARIARDVQKTLRRIRKAEFFE